MLKELVEKRNIPLVWDGVTPWEIRRKELVDILLKEEYGYMPKKPTDISFETVMEDTSFCAGKALLRKVNANIFFGDDKYTFPIYCALPNIEGKCPFIVHINFRSDFPDRYMPAEEIVDRGYGVLMYNYNEVTVDAYPKEGVNDLYSVLYKGEEIKNDSAGKIMIWANAASWVLEYALTLPMADPDNLIVAGHSRLGKTALLAGALEERFKFVYSNDSGCSGAAITRDKIGETLWLITRDETFRYWFNENYYKHRDDVHSLPFDQHFLIAASAPRYVYVASAKLDSWADPESEFLSCVAASEVWEKLGKKGLITPDKLPTTSDNIHEGDIGYHIREGAHYFSREDWNRFLDFVDSKIK